MLHRLTAFRDTPNKFSKAELESVGLGDPTLSLRRRAFNDLFLIALIYIVVLMIALALDLGDAFHAFVVSNEQWEVDEFILAAFMSMVAFTGFSWRQWYRYSSEISRRLKLEQDMVEMRVMADHLGDNKALFLSNLAHDLRTPLNGILGFAQFLEEEPFGPIGSDRYKTYAASIRESAVMLNDRIDTCLDPEKIDFGAEPMQMMPFKLSSAVDKALPVIKAIAESGSIRVETDIAGGLPDIHGDVRALKKILINLATSAIKHCGPRSKVRISAAMKADGALALHVEDDGAGMDMGLIEALKNDEPTAGNPISTDGVQGTGLFVVKNLADMHDATLDILNGLRSGTRVTVTFPATRLIRTA